MPLAPSQILVAGCGELGGTLASELSEKGFDVSVIAEDVRELENLSDSFSGFTEISSPISYDALVRAGIEGTTYVLATARYDATNILVSQIARRTFGIDEVYCRLYDERREVLIEPYGIKALAPRRLCELEFSRQSGIVLDGRFDSAPPDFAGRVRRSTRRNNLQILVITTGSQGFYLVGSLIEAGHGVHVVCEDEVVARHFADAYDATEIICANPRNAESYLDVETAEIDLAVSLLSDDADNYVCCQIAGEVFDIPRVICTVRDPRNVKLFESLGVDAVISSAYNITHAIAPATTDSDITELLNGLGD